MRCPAKQEVKMRYALATGLTCAALASLPGSAVADPALGLWLTEADKKGQVAHVAVTECGAALCGKIVKAFDPSGKQITTPNVGKRVFWDMTPLGNGEYEGCAFVPAHNREYAGQMTLKGNRLDVGGCLGPICMSQRWTRVQ
jgi:uncharacterized protein (DUF2147 family)